MHIPGSEQSSLLSKLTISIAEVAVSIVGISVIPQTILEFKNSVMLKRIGASQIKIRSFILTIILLNIGFMLFTFLWTILWGGAIFGSKYGWENIIHWNNIAILIPNLILLIITSILFGLTLSTILKNVSPSAFITISMMIFIPVAFLSGSFMPADFISESKILSIFSYINPFKYTFDPLTQAWMDDLNFNWVFFCKYGIQILLIISYILIIWKLFKWEK